MAEEGKDNVSYEMLQDLLRAERRSNKMMPVPARFWPQVREFLATITAAFQAEQAKDPFGRKVMLLTDQVKNARHAAESLWAVRERKLAMLALAATKDRKRPEGLTPDEGQLYQAFLDTLDGARGRLFDGLLPAPGAGPAPIIVPAAAAAANPAGASAPSAPSAHLSDPSAPSAPSAPATPFAPSAPQPGPPAAPQAPAAAAAAPAVQMPVVEASPVQVPHDSKANAAEGMVTIRALGDIPPFVGPDMQTYLLKTGDIATVPPSIANLLVRRQKASILEL